MSFFFHLLTCGVIAPQSQASNIVITGITSTELSFSWSNGNGDKRLILVKASSIVSDVPSDDTTYIANTIFGTGDQIGSGNYVVFNGDGNSVTITGLTADTVYHIRVFEYNGDEGLEKYNIGSSTNNPESQSTFTTQYQGKLDRADTLVVTKPSLAWQIDENVAVKSFISTGKWDEADKIYMLANDGSIEFGELELKNPSANRLTQVANGGALVWTSGIGTKSDGLAYYNSSINLAGLTQFQQEDAFIGMVFHGLPANTSQLQGCRDSSSVRCTTNLRRSDDTISSIFNCGTALNTAYVTIADDFNYLSMKRDGNLVTNRANEAEASGSLASTGVPAASYFVLASNNGGTLTAGSQVLGSLAFLCIGSKDLDGILDTVEDFFS